MSDELKTPLRVAEHNWQHTTIYDSDLMTLCSFDLEDWDVSEDNQDELEAKMSRVVRAIVHRVNCHDKLVEALEGMIEVFVDTGTADEDMATVKTARSALELAKGGSHE